MGLVYSGIGVGFVGMGLKAPGILQCNLSGNSQQSTWFVT